MFVNKIAAVLIDKFDLIFSTSITPVSELISIILILKSHNLLYQPFPKIVRTNNQLFLSGFLFFKYHKVTKNLFYTFQKIRRFFLLIFKFFLL